MRIIKTNESLSRPEIYILMSLASEERHGYDIVKQVAVISNGKMRLGGGTLYTATRRLVSNRLIVPIEISEMKDRRIRKYYKLTEKGRKMLEIELSHFRNFASLNSFQ